MKVLAAALALGLAAPAVAQPQPAPPAAHSPEHLAAAERVVALILPPGGLATLLNDEAAMQNEMFAAIGAAVADGEEADPHLVERMRITNEVTNQAVAEVLTELEPQFRSLFATLLVRRFTVPELDELAAFFTTPAGRKYAEMTFTIGQDPALTEFVLSLVPRMIEAGPRIEERVRAATAHLPPPELYDGGADE